jgi:hypothetical protein
MSEKFPQFDLQPEQQETKGEKSNQCRKIFDGVYEQLKPQSGADVKRSAYNFVESLINHQDHIAKIDKEAPLDQSIEKIWEGGMGKKLAYFKSNPDEFERRKTKYTAIYSGLKTHIKQVTDSGEVEPITAKVFLENFLTLKDCRYYNSIVRNPEERTEQACEKYHTAFGKLYSMYAEEKIVEEGGFFHFNSNTDLDANHRFYLSANLSGSPDKLVNAWSQALTETGLQDKIYFKLPEQLSQRYETVIVYHTGNTSDEEMERVMVAFDGLCPKDACAERNMPSAVPITWGISYAPEPGNLNGLFRAMNLKFSENDEVPITISYNDMIAGFTQLSFEMAYKDYVSDHTERPDPKDLKANAGKYFEQFITLAGINPETMVPNSQGGKLPAWAEKLSKEKN